MNTFGRIFRVSLFGESHGPAVGVLMDGVEPGLPLSEEDFMTDIRRRKSGAPGTTPRIEEDRPEIVSGVFEGHTTGAPLTVLFRNGNTRSGDYELLRDVPRPGHADLVASIKTGGFNDPRGGGHFSGRLTLPLVAAGVVAKKILSETVRMETEGHVAFSAEARIIELGGVSREEALGRAGQEASDPELWAPEIAAVTEAGDSLGAVVECVVDGLPAALGEPFWDSVESLIAHAVFAIPGVRGVEFGDGFAASRMRGSEHNDCFEATGHGIVAPRTNHAGGVNGGLTNGNPIVFRVAFKPTSSIRKPQQSYNMTEGEMTELVVPGRHDTCFALRTPVIVEAAAAIVLADLIDIA